VHYCDDDGDDGGGGHYDDSSGRGLKRLKAGGEMVLK